MPNSATLVQALLAAFCAILCALSGMGGGGMMCGSRIGAWAKAGGWVNPYVTDSLVAMWDGEWNAGGGVHDQNATAWKDLVGANDMMPTSNYDSPTIGINHLIFSNSGVECVPTGDLATFDDSKISVEMVFLASVNKSEVGLFSIGSNITSLNLTNQLFLNTAQWDAGHGTVRFRSYNGSQVSSKSNMTSFSLLSFVGGGDSYAFYKNGVSIESGERTLSLWPQKMTICAVGGLGGSATGIGSYNGLSALVYCVRVYNRAISPEEIAANYAIDKARFNLT